MANITWERVVLDGANRIKNQNTKLAKLCSGIKAHYRWAITDSAIYDSSNVFYSLVKFLNYEPLNDLSLWNFLFKSEQGKATKKTKNEHCNKWIRLLSDYLILRRIKFEQLEIPKRGFVGLPGKNIEEIMITLSPGEKAIYNFFFIDSKKILALEKLSDSDKLSDLQYAKYLSEISKLRMACCHLNLLDKSVLASSQDVECLKESFVSSKLEKVRQKIVDIANKYPSDKMIVVSEWAAMSRIIGRNLLQHSIEHCEINDDLTRQKQNNIVNKFNSPNNKDMCVMLLSLKSGIESLDLIGANHMLFTSIHWDPSIELKSVACIHRSGQTKDVFIYKFMCENTIDEHIRAKQIQNIKSFNSSLNNRYFFL